MAAASDSTPAPAWRLRRQLEAAIEAAIALLDLIDHDPDLEPDACFEAFLQHEIRGGANGLAA